MAFSFFILDQRSGSIGRQSLGGLATEARTIVMLLKADQIHARTKSATPARPKRISRPVKEGTCVEFSHCRQNQAKLINTITTPAPDTPICTKPVRRLATMVPIPGQSSRFTAAQAQALDRSNGWSGLRVNH